MYNVIVHIITHGAYICSQIWILYNIITQIWILYNIIIAMEIFEQQTLPNMHMQLQHYANVQIMQILNIYIIISL